MERWIVEARFALRRLRTRPTYTLLAVLTLRETAGRALAPIETDEMFQSAGQTAGSASSR